MKKIFLLTFLVCRVFLLVGCSSDEAEQYVVSPMIKFDGKVYQDVGGRLTELPSDDYVREKILYKIPQTKIPDKDLTTNFGKVGDEFYYSPQDLSAIYFVVKDEEGNFKHYCKFQLQSEIQYELGSDDD